MKLPKLYRVVNLEFDSLRNGLGSSMGVIFDIDTIVKRKARRVLSEFGWKWQIVNFKELLKYEYFIETDQECLNQASDCGNQDDFNWS